MVSITADSSIQAELERLEETVEIRDRSGRLIGYFTPAAVREADLYRRARQHFDPEELKRRKNEPHESYTTSEVLEYVRSLGAE
ncbi:MAG TPA: hypothetical protein VML55_00040 [Planctomycetaceae bacterium]|nr:hypothetical protein [Planctomycetaceae bacterium]